MPQVTRIRAIKALTTARLTNRLILAHHIVVDGLDTVTLTNISIQTVDSITGNHRPVATLTTISGLLQHLEAMTAHLQVPGIHLAARLRQQTSTNNLPSFMRAPIRSGQ